MKYDHTQEPWDVQMGDPMNPINQQANIYSKFLSTTDGHKYVDDPVALFMTGANAKRIVQCVNALAGIDDPEAFMKTVKFMSDQWCEKSDDMRCTETSLCLTEYCYPCMALTLLPKEQES